MNGNFAIATNGYGTLYHDLLVFQWDFMVYITLLMSICHSTLPCSDFIVSR